MKKAIVIFIVLMVTMPVMMPRILAATTDETEQKVVDVNNKWCPYSFHPVSGSDFWIYKGKRYGFCGNACVGAFSNDPDKYIENWKKQEELLNAPPATADAVPASETSAETTSGTDEALFPETASESDAPLFPESAQDTNQKTN